MSRCFCDYNIVPNIHKGYQFERNNAQVIFSSAATHTTYLFIYLFIYLLVSLLNE